MQFNKISSHPPSKKSLESFISEAGERKREQNSTKQQKTENCYPWNDPMVRADIQKVFTVKLPEEYILKIKFLSEKTNKSQQKIIREIICQEIDKLLLE
jgi:hypothetical protein